MINHIFVNILLLVSVTFVGGHILKDISVKKLKTIPYRFLIGCFCGLLGMLFIIYTLPVEEAGTYVDLRVYALMIASYVGGTLPTAIAGSIILVFRIFHSGSYMAHLMAVIQIVSFIISFALIDRITKQKWKRWVYKEAVTILVLILTYYPLLYKVEHVKILLLGYALMVMLAGVLEYFLLEYVKTTNDLYRKYKLDSTKDFLTGLTNTRQFDKMLNMAFERVQQNHELLTCFMVDIDFFKKINDTYGHAVGDLVLKELAALLQRCVRTTDVIARVGGEEFCALLFNCAREDSFEIALSINKAVKEHSFPIGDNKYINITVSVGVSVYPEMTENPENLKELADTALYLAKRSGRNRVCDTNICVMSQENAPTRV
jgi:diguanylate cyclase